MKSSRLNKSFQKFIDQDIHFTKKEQEHILSAFSHKKNHKIFNLSIILLMWSLTGATIESVLIGGGTVISIIKGLDVAHFVPAIIFLILNFLAKIIFAIAYVRRYISVWQALCCGIPYIGPFIVLGFLLKNDILFLKGLHHYVKYIRKHTFLFFKSFFSVNKNSM